MKTPLLLALAAGGALLVPAPAAFAQLGPDRYAPAGVREDGDWTLKRREDWLDEHINKAHDARALDGHEADRAHHELDRIRDEENHMRGRHDGQLTDNETADLESRLDRLADQIHWAREESFRRPWLDR